MGDHSGTLTATGFLVHPVACCTTFPTGPGKEPDPAFPMFILGGGEETNLCTRKYTHLTHPGPEDGGMYLQNIGNITHIHMA
jgi:hypothetical protein